ncbi:MAG: O-antigen ligase family protein, partial [Myxococcales bacterium]|nr:O-antigen ligase family protein [Myxococcales bacterium]
RRALFAAAAGMAMVALAFMPSRGGLVGFGVGVFVFIAVVGARSVGLARAVIGAAVLLLVALAATLWANEALRHRVADRSQQLVHNQKTRGWADGLRLTAAYPWTGAGRGTFAAAIGAYRSDDEGVRLAYPENVLVQMASEWGVPLSLLLVIMVLLAARRHLPLLRRASPMVVGAGCGVLAVLVHECGDFALELPGVALPTIVVLGVVVGHASAAERHRRPRRRRLPPRTTVPVIATAAVTLVGAAFACKHTLDADFREQAARIAADNVDERDLQAAIARHPADDYLELLSAQHAFAAHEPGAFHHINRALRLHPANWQAHRLAALMLVALHRPAQAALEYRAALASGMPLDAREVAQALGRQVVDAVAQTVPDLLTLARALRAGGLDDAADDVAVRALDVAGDDGREAVLIARTELALDANRPRWLVTAARALAAQADT